MGMKLDNCTIPLCRFHPEPRPTLAPASLELCRRESGSRPDGTLEVAIKTLKTDAAQTDRVKFLQEAAIMGQFKHNNVVKLYGVVRSGEPVSALAVSLSHVSSENIISCDCFLQVMIVLELLAKGDLRKHLLSLVPE